MKVAKAPSVHVRQSSFLLSSQGHSPPLSLNEVTWIPFLAVEVCLWLEIGRGGYSIQALKSTVYLLRASPGLWTSATNTVLSSTLLSPSLNSNEPVVPFWLWFYLYPFLSSFTEGKLLRSLLQSLTAPDQRSFADILGRPSHVLGPLGSLLKAFDALT